MEGWDGVVCGDADLALAIVSVLLANNLRELRLRQSIEASAKLLRDHNETLKDESAKLAESNRGLEHNLTLLQTSIGLFGSQGDEWFEKLHSKLSTLEDSSAPRVRSVSPRHV